MKPQPMTVRQPVHLYGALGDTPAPTPAPEPLSTYLPTIGMIAAGYHGVKRNNGSLFWGAVWALAGHWFPVAVPTFAVAQGYGEKKECK